MLLLVWGLADCELPATVLNIHAAQYSIFM